MKVLSLKQPWAYLLCSGIKNIENRTWRLPEKYKGKTVLIHASEKRDYFLKVYDQLWELNNNHPKGGMREIMQEEGLNEYFFKSLHTSVIIGSVRFVDCVINHPSIWAEKCEEVYKENGKIDSAIYNWIVEDAILFDKPVLNVKGKLRFWDYPDERCDENCFYHCTKAGTQIPDCVKGQ